MAALRFRFAPPAVTHGAGGNLALTINADHSVGAGHHKLHPKLMKLNPTAEIALALSITTPLELNTFKI